MFHPYRTKKKKKKLECASRLLAFCPHSSAQPVTSNLSVWELKHKRGSSDFSPIASSAQLHQDEITNWANQSRPQFITHSADDLWCAHRPAATFDPKQTFLESQTFLSESRGEIIKRAPSALPERGEASVTFTRLLIKVCYEAPLPSRVGPSADIASPGSSVALGDLRSQVGIGAAAPAGRLKMRSVCEWVRRLHSHPPEDYLSVLSFFSLTRQLKRPPTITKNIDRPQKISSFSTIWDL